MRARPVPARVRPRGALDPRRRLGRDRDARGPRSSSPATTSSTTRPWTASAPTSAASPRSATAASTCCSATRRTPSGPASRARSGSSARPSGRSSRSRQGRVLVSSFASNVHRHAAGGRRRGRVRAQGLRRRPLDAEEPQHRAQPRLRPTCPTASLIKPADLEEYRPERGADPLHGQPGRAALGADADRLRRPPGGEGRARRHGDHLGEADPRERAARPRRDQPADEERRRGAPRGERGRPRLRPRQRRGAADDDRAAAAARGDAGARRVPHARRARALARRRGRSRPTRSSSPRTASVVELDAGRRRGSSTEIDAGVTFVDGLGVGDVQDVALRDRRHLAEDGVLISSRRSRPRTARAAARARADRARLPRARARCSTSCARRPRACSTSASRNDVTRDQAPAGAPPRRRRPADLRPHRAAPDDPPGRGRGLSRSRRLRPGWARRARRARRDRGDDAGGSSASSRACEVAALAFCRLLERWARGERRARARRGSARRRCGAPPTGPRRRVAGLEEPLGRYLLELEPEQRGGALLVRRAGRGRAAWSGGRCSLRAGVRGVAGARRAGLPRARRARARARGARRRGADAARRPTASSLWAGLFDLRENLLGRAAGRPARACRREPSRRGRRLGRTSTSSRGCERLPRPGETVTGASFARIPAARARTRRSPRRGSARTCASSAASAATTSRDEALDGAARARRRRSRSSSVDAPTGRRADRRRRRRRERRSSSRPGANAELRPERRRRGEADAVLCQLEIPLETVAEAARAGRRSSASTRRRRGPATRVLARADLLVVNRYELEAARPAGGLVALTLGAEGAVLLENGRGGRAGGAAAGRGRRRHRRRRRVHRVPRRLAARGRGRGTRRCAEPAPPARSPPRAPARSRRFRPPPRSTRYSR